LLEGSFNRFIFTLVQNFYKLFYRLSRLLQVITAFQELVPLLCEIVVLLERFLVNVRKLLKAFIHGVQFPNQLSTVITN
jgi:hypothetical protein